MPDVGSRDESGKRNTMQRDLGWRSECLAFSGLATMRRTGGVATGCARALDALLGRYARHVIPISYNCTA